MFEKLIKQLIKNELSIFQEYRLAHFDEAIIQAWNPYALSDAESFKTFWLVRDLWIRLLPDGEVKTERFKASHIIPPEVAKQYQIEIGVPIFNIEGTDMYELKLEYEQAKKRLEIPLEISVDGVIVKYRHPLLPTVIVESIKKWGMKREEATEGQIINYMTSPIYGGWLPRTVENIEKIKSDIKGLVKTGTLIYDEERGTYKISGVFPGATPVGER